MKLITNIQNKDYLEIGIIANTHKLDGTVKIKFYSDNDILEKYNDIYIFKNGMYTKINIIKKIKNKNRLNNKENSSLVISRIQGVNNIEEAQYYKGKKLYIKRKEIDDISKMQNQMQNKKQKDLKKDKGNLNTENKYTENEEIYIIDVIGIDVIYNEEKIGIVEDVLTNVPTEIFVIKTDKIKDKLNNSNQILVPYIGKYIKSIDIKSKKCIVDISELI